MLQAIYVGWGSTPLVSNPYCTNSLLASCLSLFLPLGESILELFEWSNHLFIVSEILAREHDTEPARLRSSVLSSSLDHPSTILIQFFPKLVFGVPGVISEEASEVNPSHQSTLRLENWDASTLESILEGNSRNLKSLPWSLNKVINPLLVLENFLQKELSVRWHLMQHTKGGARGPQNIFILGEDETYCESIDTEVFTEATSNVNLILKPVIVSLVRFILFDIMLIEPNLGKW